MVVWVVEVVQGPDAGLQRCVGRELEIGRTAFGRNADGLRLHDRMASRHHARISAFGKTAVLEDIGSTNGTFVNNDQVHSLVVLAAGDLIQVGVSMLELRRLDQSSGHATGVRPISTRVRASRRVSTAVIGILVVVWFSVILLLAVGR